MNASPRSPLCPRLEAILRLVEPCDVLADVCTDHALVPIHAVLRGLAQRAIAADLREAPLREAKKNAERFGVETRVHIVQGNGLAPLRNERVDVLVLAGISGSLAAQLLDAEPEVRANITHLILQVNSDVARVRAWAHDAEFHLRDESLVMSRGRPFVTCAFERKSGSDPAYVSTHFSPDELFLLGPLLLSRCDAKLVHVAEAQSGRLRALIDRGVSAHSREYEIWERARLHCQQAARGSEQRVNRDEKQAWSGG